MDRGFQAQNFRLGLRGHLPWTITCKWRRHRRLEVALLRRKAAFRNSRAQQRYLFGASRPIGPAVEESRGPHSGIPSTCRRPPRTALSNPASDSFLVSDIVRAEPSFKVALLSINYPPLHTDRRRGVRRRVRGVAGRTRRSAAGRLGRGSIGGRAASRHDRSRSPERGPSTTSSE